MDKKHGLVIQAKFIEEFKPQPDRIFYVFGIGIKVKDGNKYIKDVGLYYSPIKDQTYFSEGIEVDYYIDKNENEPKKSKIRAVVDKKESKGGSYDKMTINEYTERKMADAVAFSASYAKDICVAHANKIFVEVANEVFNWQIEKLKSL